MSHENAPATKLLATACACCGRDLVDAVSVETGIGPECRKKYAIDTDVSEAARQEANALVYSVAQKGIGIRKAQAAFERLAELGFVVLAERIAKRFRATLQPKLSEAEVAQLRKEYAKLRTDFCYDNGYSAGDFDAHVRSQDPRGPLEFVKLAKEVTCMCKRCGGSGQYVRYSGSQMVSSSDCFRCGGKGHQTLDDARRNRAYDELALNRALRAG
jgi:hypothetical protein